MHWIIGFVIKSKFCARICVNFHSIGGKEGSTYFTIFKYGVVISIKTGKENIMASLGHAKILVGSAVPS